MELKILFMFKNNLYLVWHNGGIFKDRVNAGIFIIMKAVQMTANDLQVTEQQIVNVIPVNQMGNILLEL